MTKNEELSDKIRQKYNLWLSQVKHFAGDEACDVLNDVLVYMYDHNIVPDTDYYVIKSCKNSLYCKNSPYARKRDKHLPFTDYDGELFEEMPEEDSDDMESIDIWATIETIECSWWEKELFKRKVLEDKSFQEIADDTGLTVGQVYYSYIKVKNALKNILK